jgi:hypothetical protein
VRSALGRLLPLLPQRSREQTRIRCPTPFDERAEVKLTGDVVAKLEPVAAALA